MRGSFSNRIRRWIGRNGAQRLIRYGGEGELSVGLHHDAQDYPQLETGRQQLSGYVSQVVFVGFIHEMGLTKNKKYKQWLYKAIELNNSERTRELVRVFRQSENNVARRRQLLDTLGRNEIRKVRLNVDQNRINLPANEPSTLERKDSNTPMINTKHLVGQLDYKVENVE